MDILDFAVLAVTVGILLVLVWWLIPKPVPPIEAWRQELLDEIVNTKLRIREMKHSKTVERAAALEKIYEQLGETIVQYADGSIKTFNGLKWLVHGEHVLKMKVQVKRRYAGVQS